MKTIHVLLFFRAIMLIGVITSLPLVDQKPSVLLMTFAFSLTGVLFQASIEGERQRLKSEADEIRTNNDLYEFSNY